MRLLAIFGLGIGIVVLPATAGAVGLGSAGDFNAFIFGNLTYSNTDFQGRVAVGGSATLQNMGIGPASGITGSTTLTENASRNDLIVAGSLSFTNGQFYKGSGQVGGTRTSTGVNFLVSGAGWNTGTSIDFVAAQAEMIGLSTLYGGMSANGAKNFSSGGMTLTSAASGISVFNLTTAELASTNSFTINGDGTSQILVNVTGGSAVAQNFGFFLNGVSANNILFNFTNAGALSLSGIGFQGSILAPLATVSFANGNINGSMVAANLTGSGEFHNFPPSTVVPEPFSIAGLGLGVLALARRRRKTA